jgi:3-oxoacyl-[acyl-carrier protein] reductase
MKAKKWGRIVNISSMSVLQPIDNLILSNAVRMGVQGLAKSVSLELAPFNVTVNSVCPGFTRSERVEGMIASTAVRDGITAEQAEQRLAGTTAVGRIGDPSEVGDAVAYLASERAAFMTGTVMPLAGGGVRASI